MLDVPRQLLEQVLPDASWLTHLAHVRRRFVATMAVTSDDLAALDGRALTSDLTWRLRAAGCAVGAASTVDVETPGSSWQLVDPESGHGWTARVAAVGGASPTELELSDQERAVVASCRATRPGRSYQAYLVSLEHRFTTSPSGTVAFDYGSATTPNDLVRAIALDSWAFSVDADAGRLEHLLRGLVTETPTPAPTPAPAGTSPALPAVRNLDLAVPTTNKSGPGVERLLGGYALVRHSRRNGGDVLSWYRGPLVADTAYSPFVDPAEFPLLHADELLGMDARSGMLLTSYSAAWELGRQLTLADQKAALELVRWRTARHHATHRVAHRAKVSHMWSDPGADVPLPESLRTWFGRLALLDGVPFGHLVPDPAMLPPESLRTFVIDPVWLACVFDGSFAAGRVLHADARRDAADWASVRAAGFAALAPGGLDPQGPPPTVSGVLIRSSVISGWPKLQIDAYPPDGAERSPILRRAPLADNVLLLLVAGRLGRLELHANPEALHLGLRYETAANPGDAPTWSYIQRDEQGASSQVTTTATMRGDDVLDIAHARIKSDGTGDTTPAEFALKLLAGVPRLVLHLTPEGLG